MWTPLLEGEDAARAKSFVSRATAELATSPVTDPSVAYGLSGVALLHGFRAMAGEADADEALVTLERVIEHLQERPTPWLFVGYAGVGLTAQLLAPVLGDQDELLAQLDDLVYPVLERDEWNHEWELQIGLIGLGVYAITRGHDDRAQQVFRHLMSLARVDADGASWATPFLEGPPNFNLGMAHGAASVVAFLSLLCRPDRPEVRDALAGAVRWLRAQENVTAVPSFGQEVGAPSFRAALPPADGWCYGDAATALVFTRAATCLVDPSLRAAALELARRDARRTLADLAHCTLDDTLCHGPVGRAHLFHDLALLHDDEELARAARFWYVAALEYPPILRPDIGLQTGLAGHTLAMLAGYSAVPPTWGRIMLIR